MQMRSRAAAVNLGAPAMHLREHCSAGLVVSRAGPAGTILTMPASSVVRDPALLFAEAAVRLSPLDRPQSRWTERYVHTSAASRRLRAVTTWLVDTGPLVARRAQDDAHHEWAVE